MAGLGSMISTSIIRESLIISHYLWSRSRPRTLSLILPQGTRPPTFAPTISIVDYFPLQSASHARQPRSYKVYRFRQGVGSLHAWTTGVRGKRRRLYMIMVPRFLPAVTWAAGRGFSST